MDQPILSQTCRQASLEQEFQRLDDEPGFSGSVRDDLVFQASAHPVDYPGTPQPTSLGRGRSTAGGSRVEETASLKDASHHANVSRKSTDLCRGTASKPGKTPLRNAVAQLFLVAQVCAGILCRQDVAPYSFEPIFPEYWPESAFHAGAGLAGRRDYLGE